jgi:uroporphyrin-III C-methyltransferase/precorrin-2 dehydrogenase/sirohydrochlorin ferrochelatase
LIVALVVEGHRVVRLKGSDPMLFARAGEEIAAARAHGIAVEVVPGVTAAQGAAASLLCSLTHRDHARRVQFVTGQDRTGGLPEGLTWRALADPGATTVVYMGRRTLPALARRVLALGLPPGTPLAVVVNATRGGEETIVSTVGRLAADPSALADLPEGPALVLYGAVLAEIAECAPTPAVEPALRHVA